MPMHLFLPQPVQQLMAPLHSNDESVVPLPSIMKIMDTPPPKHNEEYEVVIEYAACITGTIGLLHPSLHILCAS